MAIEVLEKRNKEFNPLCEKLIKDVYEKWLNIFFSDYVEHYHKLNSHKIGLKMKLIREANDMNKTELALRLNVNRKTIALLEDGERLPSLEYIYNFCKIFFVVVFLVWRGIRRKQFYLRQKRLDIAELIKNTVNHCLCSPLPFQRMP